MSGVDAIGGGADDPFQFIGTAAFSNTAGELRYSVSGGQAQLTGDTTGDGQADFLVVLFGVGSLASSAFIL